MPAGDTTVLEHYLHPFRAHLDDERVTEIVVNKPGEFAVEREGRWTWIEAPQLSPDWLGPLAIAAAAATAQDVQDQHPICTTVLPTGERCQIVLPPAADSISLTFRRPSRRAADLEEMIGEGLFDEVSAGSNSADTLDQRLLDLHRAREWRAFFTLAVESRRNILISGATGAGKTTLAKGLIRLIPQAERLITIEDARELQTPHRNAVHLLYAKDGQGLAQIGPKALLESALRMRPDRILLQELRDEAAYFYLRNVNSGHPGSITTIRTDLGAIFVSLELSRSTWLITSLSPGAGEKLSKHVVPAGDLAGLLGRFAQLNEKASARLGRSFPIIAIQEAGLDGFWIHRVLEDEGIESHVVDAASILTSRRRRRAKTDRIDGETLVRTLMAYKRGEPRVCSMVRAPTPEEEDRRRLCRERKTLVIERIEHTNRIKGLLCAQGIFDYDPLRRNRRTRLEELTTGDGRPMPARLKTQIRRELDRLEILLAQLKAVEAERDALVEPASSEAPTPATMLARLKGIGPEFAAVLWSEALYRRFDNRRQLAAYAGLAPTPWKSGSIDHEQGVSKAGNPRLRTTMIQVAWLWPRHQPGSALSVWFLDRVQRNGGRMRKSAIVALARKLLVAFWKYVTQGVVIEGAVVQQA